MSTLGYIIVFTLIGSIASLAGGILLLAKEQWTRKISHLLASFAAGTLLATAFFELLPEAAEETGGYDIFFICLLGIIGFFLLERFIHSFNHPHKDEKKEYVKPTVALVTFGDSLHNFIDGIVIAGTFLVSIPLGITTAIAVAFHEIPQEIGDFGLLLHQGLSKKKIILFNVLSAFTSMVGAFATYFIGNSIEGFHPILLALTSGFFIYIALANLIPEIHEKNKRGFALLETLALLLGVFLVWILTTYIEHAHT